MVWGWGLSPDRRRPGCWAERVGERRRYPSDLTDERWALIEPVIAAWKAAHPSVSGHQGSYKMREIVNAILYQSRTGCQWDYLPHDLLRWQVREKAGRSEDPSLVVLDTQSVHAAVNVRAATTGKDAAKKVPGRKRGLAVDVLGLVIVVAVLAASVHDNRAGTLLLERVAAQNASVAKALVDQGFKSAVVAPGATLGIDVEIVERNPAEQGFVALDQAALPNPSLETDNHSRIVL